MRAYALLELAIGLSALAVPHGVDLSERAYLRLFGGSEVLPAAGAWGTTLFQLASVTLVLALPTICMGATLPIVARFLVRSDRQVGPATGLLYAVNTAGAVVGAPLTAFFLLPGLGLRLALLVGVALNLTAALTAWLLSRRAPAAAAGGGQAAGRPSAPAREQWVLALLVSVSGAVSLLYEVVWTRLLSHPLGGSIYSFATMLASFLAGIALGSALASRFAGSPRQGAHGFALAQLGTAAFSGASLLLLAGLSEGVALAGGPGQPVWRGPLLSAVVLLPSAVCIGATFPFAVRVLARRAEEAGAASARVYAWSTFGSVAGAIVTGLFLLPAMGFAGALTVGLACNLLLALVAATLLGERRQAPAFVALAGLVVLAVLPPRTPWRILRTGPLAVTPLAGEIVHQAVGRSATVLLAENEGIWQLTTNGLPEGSIQPPGWPVGRYLVTSWLGALPVLARPQADSMLVVGLGAGELLEAVPTSIESIDVVEIEAEVVNANRAVGAERRRDPLADPRVRVVLNDARSALQLGERTYDVIVSQPSHPWASGSAHLYTAEFFGLVRAHVAPGGVFEQWIGLAFVDEALLRSLLATLSEVFSEVRVYRPPTGAALLFLASDSPLPIEAASEALAAGVVPPELGIARIEDLAAALVLDEAGVRALGTGASLITDDRNILESRSPRVLGRALGRDRGESVLAAFDPLVGQGAAEFDLGALARRLLATGPGERARRVVESAPVSASRQGAMAELALRAGRAELAASLLGDSLNRDPRSAEVRALSLRLAEARISSGAEPDGRLGQLDSLESAVVAGWRAAAVGDWRTVQAIDDDLALARAGEPLFASATRLRAAWRIAASDPASALEAVGMLDVLLARRRLPEDLLSRARAAAAANDARSTLATLDELAERAARQPRWGSLARAGLQLMPPAMESEAGEAWRRLVAQRLTAVSGG